jgi:ribose 5-phosphate isomerase A
LLREQFGAAATRFYIIIVDESKLVRQLGKFPLPVEVAPFGWELTFRRLQELGGEPKMRLAGGGPFLTDNQHYILDTSFGLIPDPAGLHERVSAITGVMEDGFFIQMADMVIAGLANGDTKELERKR